MLFVPLVYEKGEQMEKGNKQIHDELLREQIAIARATAPTREELEKVLQEEADLHNLFLQGEISGKELKQKLVALNRLTGVVKTEDPEEYRRILELIGLAEEAIQEFMNAEMPHYTEAREQALKPMLRVQFFKLGGESWGIHAQTEVIYPAELADEVFRMAHRKTLSAPGEEKLSRLDRKGLGLE